MTNRLSADFPGDRADQVASAMADAAEQILDAIDPTPRPRTRLSAEQIEAIRERAATATPGPWTTIDPPWGDGSAVCTGTGDPHGQRLICDTNEREWQGDASNVVEDAEFIARARTDIPLLLAELDATRRERDTLAAIAADLQLMARRYAAGRCSTAPGTLNDATRQLQALGVKLNECDGTVFAHDGMGRHYDQLSAEDAEASMESMGNIWSREPEIQAAMERVAQAERERDEARVLLVFLDGQDLNPPTELFVRFLGVADATAVGIKRAETVESGLRLLMEFAKTQGQ